MATDQQMAALGNSESVGFDRQFLQLMIRHHEGAVDMVKDLLDKPGSAYDPLLFEFVGDVKNDQMVEIERMNALLVTLSDDPRANLKPGLTDAGIAIKNMTCPANFSVIVEQLDLFFSENGLIKLAEMHKEATWALSLSFL